MASIESFILFRKSEKSFILRQVIVYFLMDTLDHLSMILALVTVVTPI